MTTQTQRYNCFTRNEGNAIPKHAGPEAKGSNPTVRLTLLWAGNPFRGNFKHWQVSRKEAKQIFFIFCNLIYFKICRFAIETQIHGASNMTGTDFFF